MRFTKKYKWHIVFWFINFWYAYFTDKLNDPETHIISEVLFYLTHNLFLFYSLLFIFQRVSKTSKSIFYYLSFFLADLIVFFLIRYVMRFYLIPAIGIPEPATLDLKIHLFNGTLWYLNYFFFAAGYFYFQSSIQKQKDLLKATEEKAAKDKEAAELENKALRAQINPHFLFNTLGYFYNEVSNTHPQVGDGIAALSDIMRSAIRKPDKDGLIPLEEEINNIEQLISIYELRYSNNLHISFKQEGDNHRLRILPHILNTLVENAFKHGELHNSEYPLTINLNIDSQSLQFTVNDKKRIGPKELSHGIGMNYIRSHLNSFYKDRYSLTIDDQPDFYTVSLLITFN